jgi:uncharacterized membrane protein
MNPLPNPNVEPGVLTAARSARTASIKAKVLLATTFIIGVIQCLVYRSRMPEKVAIHFGPLGLPDSWATRDMNCMLGIMVFCIMTALMILAPHLIRVVPVSLVNLPHKDYWLAPARREETITEVSARLYAFGSAVNLFFVAVTCLVWLANRSDPVKLDTTSVLLCLGCFMFFTAAWLYSFLRYFHRTGKPPVASPPPS